MGRIMQVLRGGTLALESTNRPKVRAAEEIPSCSLGFKKQVQTFWQGSPCDSWFTEEAPGTAAFYQTLDEHRYTVHPSLHKAVCFEKTRGLRVLEIGCGCGSEAERFARAGAHYTAVDLTNAAVSITQRRFQLAGLKGRFVQGDAENLPFEQKPLPFPGSVGRCREFRSCSTVRVTACPRSMAFHCPPSST